MIEILDREKKANFEIRVINKETGKSRTISLISPAKDEEELRDMIVACLEKRGKNDA